MMDCATFMAIGLALLASVAFAAQASFLFEALLKTFGPDPANLSFALAGYCLAFCLGAWVAAKPIRHSSRPAALAGIFQMVGAICAASLTFFPGPLQRLLFSLEQAIPNSLPSLLPAATLTAFVLFLIPAATNAASALAVLEFVRRRKSLPESLSLVLLAFLVGSAIGIQARAFGAGNDVTLAAKCAALIHIGGAIVAAMASQVWEGTAMSFERDRHESHSDSQLGQRFPFAAGLCLGLGLFLLFRLVLYASGGDGMAGGAAAAAFLAAAGLGALGSYFLAPRSGQRGSSGGWLLLVFGLSLAIAANSLSRALQAQTFQDFLREISPSALHEWFRHFGVFLPFVLIPSAAAAAVIISMSLPKADGWARANSRMDRAFAATCLGVSAGLALHVPLVALCGVQLGLTLVAVAATWLGAAILHDRRHYLVAAGMLVLFAFVEPPELPPMGEPSPSPYLSYSEDPRGVLALLADENRRPARVTLNGIDFANTAWNDRDRLLELVALAEAPEGSFWLSLGHGSGETFHHLGLWPELGEAKVLLPFPAVAHMVKKLRENQPEHRTPFEFVFGEQEEFLAASQTPWPFIVLSLHWRPAPAARARLVSEHFLRQVKSCLDAKGVFVLSVPARLPPELFRTILHRFSAVFELGHVWAFAPGEVVLTGHRGRTVFSEESLARLRSDQAKRFLTAAELGRADVLLGSRVCELAALRKETEEDSGRLRGMEAVRREFRRAAIASRPEWWRANLELLAQLVDDCPLEVETADESLAGNVDAATEGLRHLLKGLASSQSESDLKLGKGHFLRGLDANPGDSRLLALLQAIEKRESSAETPTIMTHGPDSNTPTPTPTPPPEDEWKFHMKLAEEAFRRKQYPQAIQEYRLAQSLAPDRREPNFSIAVTLTQLGRHDEAFGVYEKLLLTNPNDVEARINQGFIRSGQNRFEEAEACYRRALEIDPGSALGHYNLATLLRRRERIEEAIDEYEAALLANPDYAQAVFDYAILLHDREEYYPALGLFRRFVRLLPNSTHAQAVREKIRELEKKRLVK